VVGKSNNAKFCKAMKTIIKLIQVDLQQVFRDKTLTSFLFAPIILILAVRYGVPWLGNIFPIVKDYYHLIVMFASIQTAIMFGFIISFIILDEKDENVIQVIRILPIAPAMFVFYRLAFATFFSTLGAFTILKLNGIINISVTNSVLLSMQYGLTAPFITLIVGTYANNKIEGMAFFKGIDLFLIIPILYFFLQGWVKHIFAFIPAYWTFRLFEKSVQNSDSVLFFLYGLVVYLLVIFILFIQFKKRVLDN
jgi:fluoroquinolone transport system permease protein